MRISLIGAMGEDRVIGAGGRIPWHLPADFRHFKAITMGHPIVMGRKTFESIGRPLPGRTNIVITRDAGYQREGVIVVPSPGAALDAARGAAGADEVFVIGGAEIYKLFLPQAEKIYLTKVHGVSGGDVFFPELDEQRWKLTGSEPHAKDADNPFDYDFLMYSSDRPS